MIQTFNRALLCLDNETLSSREQKHDDGSQDKRTHDDVMGNFEER